MSSLIKDINWLISKGMCVLLFDVFIGCSLVQLGKKNRYVKHLLLGKTDVLKTSILSERKFALPLTSKKVRVYSGKRLFWYYRLQLSFVYKNVSQISFHLL